MGNSVAGQQPVRVSNTGRGKACLASTSIAAATATDKQPTHLKTLQRYLLQPATSKPVTSNQ
jgi:hypothetical protein